MVFDRVKEILCDQLDVEPEKVTMDSLIADDLGADSLDVAQIIMGIEEEFDVEVDSEVASKVTTVGQALELIKNAIGE